MNPQSEDLRRLSVEPHLPSTPRSKLRTIFYGEEGLRAGWSLLLFVLIFAGFAFAAIHIARAVHPHDPKAAKEQAISLYATFTQEGIALLILLGTTWIMSKVEGRTFSSYGLRGRRKLRNLVTGLFWGVASLSLLALILWKAGLLLVDGRGLFGSDVLRYGVAWLAAFALIAFFEEFLFRGYIQYTLARGLAGMFRSGFESRHAASLGFWTAAVFWAVLFGLVHKSNGGESPIGLVCASLASLLFSFSLWRTGSLWWAIGLHTTWDYAQSFLYGVGDSGTMMRQHLLITHPAGNALLSGGTTGPEGSLFVLPVMLLLVLVIVFTLPHTVRDYVREDRIIP
ncbi:MAG: CPBP family intramembrane metalloprotease [Acidobacteriota bacterium]|nr:CPBP family intramembrane metalloprotease [Acidobacteriota bacterium]